MAAASVGVAQPAMIVPRTAAIRKIGGSSAWTEMMIFWSSESSSSSGAKRGPYLGLIVHKTRMYNM